MEKRHIVEHNEFDVFVGEDEHELPLIVEDVFKEMGFKQLAFPQRKQLSPAIDGIRWIDNYYLSGKFFGDQFNVEILRYGTPDERMLIWRKERYYGYPTVDEGRPYNIDSGLIRLKELMNGSK